ncbi:MAG: hypothetical protein BAJALOKI3v1_260042 [Promethearchaeota archaeon]|jgi:proteasome lid subunit RPN8/RPN11|nr:MAG: hypothetical protein BAJALOKI3v1_260042 [Candidatus Lokiarchaeota archaeon]
MSEELEKSQKKEAKEQNNENKAQEAFERKKVSEKQKEERKETTPSGTEEETEFEKPVVINVEAYKTIILYASRYANKSIPAEEWKEIYGLLIGYTDDDFVYVENAEALTFGHSTDVQLDERHYGFIQEIEDKLEGENKNRYIVGWFHSHPGLGLFFSYIDLINQLGFQGANADAIGLVFDHTLLGKKKKEEIEGTDQKITKFDTGFEIYRLTDVEMDVNAPEYDTNYHKVDYIVKGLNKFFFANVLSELSALVSAGKPLQTAYGEDFKLESNYSGDLGQIQNQEPQKREYLTRSEEFDMDVLEEIPMGDQITFNGDDLFYGTQQKPYEDERVKKQAIAEELVYEGNQALKKKDIFVGVEKYREAIQKYEEIGDIGRVLELLKLLSENCISSNHLILAEEFAEKLKLTAEKEESEFYQGEGNYLLGYLLLKRGDNNVLEDALNQIRDAAILFEKAGDYVGAAQCFHKIGTIYQTRLNLLENSCLFYREAIENYNKAIIKSHPLRKSLWTKPELLIQKITDLNDILEELLPKLEDTQIRRKIREDLNKIIFNY